jgi:hypothetical protein
MDQSNSRIKTSISDLKNKVLSNITNSTFIITLLVILVALTLVILVIIYISNTLKKNAKNCKNIAKPNKLNAKLSSITNEKSFSYNLRDYYIKTAYNACSAGYYKNDYVNICALENAIRKGARCLDFEIYSVNNKPVIATSTRDNFYTKETYNYVSFTKAIQTIKNKAFSNSTCPNFTDPLIINLRIKSNNTIIYDAMAKTLAAELTSKLLGVKYSREYNGKNIGEVPLQKLVNKVIIMVDGTNKTYMNTKLDEYINATTGSVFVRKYTYSQIKNIQDMNDLIDYNRKNMSIIIPDRNNKKTNNSSILPMNYGCQFVGMIFQNSDNNLTYYNDFFTKNNSAFVLKPENLRYVPVTIETPPPPPKELSYEKRDIKTPFGSTYNI